jgi:iron complex transport system permease protein
MKIQNTNSIIIGYKKRQKRYMFASIILFVIVLCLASIMMIYGNTIYSPRTVLNVLMGEDIKGATFTIRTLRLPRMLVAVFCGFAFGIAGNTFQTLLGNPLASPDIIGISSGASVAAVFGILILGLDGSTVSIMAVVSGLLVSALIYILAQGDGFSNGRLILTGIGMQAFLNAILSWMLLKASEYDVSSALHWLSGSLNGVRLESVPRLAVVVLVSAIAIFLLNRHLAILQLGEAYAQTLGVRVHMTRLLLIVFSLLMLAFATSVTGPLSSVAFLSGPIASKISGGGRSNMLTSAFTGSILVLASDLVGQFCLPSRYPAGVITGILGAPYLLFLLLRMNRKGE